MSLPTDVPDHVRQHFAILDQRPQKRRALINATFFFDNCLLQLVARESVEHHRVVAKVAAELGAPAEKIAPLVEKDGFWRRIERIEGKEFPIASSPLSVTAELSDRWMELIERVHSNSLQKLQRTRPTLRFNHDEKEVLAKLTDKLTEVQGEDQEALQQMLSHLQRTPAEPKQRTVFAHGDPVLKNLILTPQERLHLIDWEMAQALGELNDYAHYVGVSGYWLKQMPQAAQLLAQMLEKARLPADPEPLLSWWLGRDLLAFWPFHIADKQLPVFADRLAQLQS
jgi:hypothetical protein